MAAPNAAQTKRCRSLLVALLRPFGREAPHWADRLIGEFGSLAGVLAAPPAAQRKLLPEAKTALGHLAVIRRSMLHALRHIAMSSPVLGNPEALAAYLIARMAHAPAEELRVLYLNAKNMVLRDERAGQGSVTELPILARPIMMRALELGAAGLILVHNHPSGDSRPSQADLQATRRIADAARTLEIVLHDHIIVARNGWSSFRELGLI